MANAKRELYDQVHCVRDAMRLRDAEPLNIIDWITTHVPQISIGTKHFHTRGMTGMLVTERGNPNDNAIILNELRSPREQNFDCTHEFIHYCLHLDGTTTIFECFDESPTQDTFREWQANEGAAELLVPFKAFAPMIKRHYNKFLTLNGLLDFRDMAARTFSVTPAMIKTRLDVMRYEILQYLDHVPLTEIEYLSMNQQDQRAISISSLNEVEEEAQLELM